MLKGWNIFFACYPNSCDFEIQLCFSHKKKRVVTLRLFIWINSQLWYDMHATIILHRYDYNTGMPSNFIFFWTLTN